MIVERNDEGEVVGEYQRGRALGSGGFAKVYEATSLRSKKKYAVKIVSKHDIADEKARSKLLL